MPEFIDKSTYHSPGDEYIVEVRYQNDGDFEGCVITTSLQTMEFLISSYRNCCEGWGVAMSLNEDELLNRKVKYVGWLGRGVRDLIEPHDDEYCYHALIEMILEGNENEGDDIVVEIDIYNCHNGYYHHMYLVKWGLYKDKDQL
ncbi:hypothetical protein MP228_002451 [Amoeboaphelidium protococcarum]|nr:hypothetical protein MP228_002451 [Amoeboaphelidium protococcarum]